jgi:riboflavin synthase
LNIVPFTQEATIIHNYQPGMKVNLEVDLVARYIERLLQYSSAERQGGNGVSEGFLRTHGF